VEGQLKKCRQSTVLYSKKPFLSVTDRMAGTALVVSSKKKTKCDQEGVRAPHQLQETDPKQSTRGRSDLWANEG